MNSEDRFKNRQNLPKRSLAEVIANIEVSINGLRLEVAALNQHVGSSTHFLLVEIDRLEAMIERLKSDQANP